MGDVEVVDLFIPGNLFCHCVDFHIANFCACRYDAATVR